MYICSMQKAAYLSILTIITFAGILSCDDAPEPGDETFPPGINIDFIPERTLDTVTVHLAETDTTIKKLDSIYNEMKDNGDADTVDILQELDFYIGKSDSLENLLDQFEDGRVKIDNFSAFGGSYVASYQDTLNDIFEFPLNPNENSTTFYFDYHNIQDTITFNYKRVSQVGLERIVLFATEVEVSYHSFDSLSRHFCQDINCNSSEITYKVYF